MQRPDSPDTPMDRPESASAPARVSGGNPSPPPARSGRPALALARILRLALAASVVLYGILTMVLRDTVAPMDLPGAVRVVLHGLAGLLVLAGLWLFRRPGQAGPRPALPPRMIIGWALFEATGVVGLVVSLLGGNGQVLILAALLLILLHPPRREWFP